MKINKLLPLAIIPFVISGCNAQNKGSDPKGSEDKGTVSLSMQGIANKDRSEPYTLSFNYDMKYFEKSATIFNDDLKMLSFASACAGSDEQIATTFFEAMGFKEHYTHDYDVTTKDSIGYFYSHKSFKDFDLFAVAIRGFEYGDEWTNNFTIGEEGDHEGFSLRAAEMVSTLKSFVNEHRQNSELPYKIWMTGYSRAGGIANVLADRLLLDSGNFISENDLFVYTFEAPAGLDAEIAETYPNVFNLINTRDLVTRIPPIEYGLKRCGVDVDIYSSAVDTLVTSFDNGIEIPQFHAKANTYGNELEFINHLIAKLLSASENEDYAEYEITTRSQYVSVFQTPISKLMPFFLSLTDEEIEALTTTLSEDGFSAFMALYQEDGLGTLLASVLGNEKVNADIKASLEVLRKYLLAHPSLLGEFISFSPAGLNQNMLDNVKRVIFMHYPEVTYSLIRNKKFAQ